jgi:hypothetical protein
MFTMVDLKSAQCFCGKIKRLKKLYMKNIAIIFICVAVTSTISYAQQTDSSYNRAGSTGINQTDSQNGNINQSATQQSIQTAPANRNQNNGIQQFQSTPQAQDPNSPVAQPLPQPQGQTQPQLQPSLQQQPEINSQPELQVLPTQPQTPTSGQPVPNSRDLQNRYNESVQPTTPQSTNPTGPNGMKPLRK